MAAVNQHWARVVERTRGMQIERNRRLLVPGAGFPGSINLLCSTIEVDRVNAPQSRHPPHASTRAVAL